MNTNINNQPTPSLISKSSKAAIIAELQTAIGILQTQDATTLHLIECQQKIRFAEELSSVYIRDAVTMDALSSSMYNGGFPSPHRAPNPYQPGIYGGIFQPQMHQQMQPQMQPMYPNNPHYMGAQYPQRAQGSTAPQQQPMANNGGPGMQPQEQAPTTTSSSGHVPFSLGENFPEIRLRPEIVNDVLAFGIHDNTQQQQHLGWINPIARVVQINSTIMPEQNAKLEHIVQAFILDYILGPKEFPVSSELMQNLWGQIKAIKPEDLDPWMFRSADRELNRDVHLMHKATQQPA